MALIKLFPTVNEVAERIIEVAPDKAAWIIRDSAELIAAMQFGTRSEAIEQGHALAERSRPCRLAVKGPDGHVAYEMIFGLDGPGTMDLGPNTEVP